MVLENRKNPQVLVFNPKTPRDQLILRKEYRNDHSGSSSEVGSELSKFKDVGSCRSINSRNQICSPNHLLPWFPGIHLTTFNRMFSNPRPRSSGGRLSRNKAYAISRDCYSNPSSASGSRSTTPKTPSRLRSSSAQRKEASDTNVEKENRKSNKNSKVLNVKEIKRDNCNQQSSTMKSRDLKSKDSGIVFSIAMFFFLF